MDELSRIVGDLELAAGPSDRGPEWCELWIDENLEGEIGEEAFSELPDRLAVALGLAQRDVVWEDREVMHVRAPGRAAGAILDAVVASAGLA